MPAKYPPSIVTHEFEIRFNNNTEVLLLDTKSADTMIAHAIFMQVKLVNSDNVFGTHPTPLDFIYPE
jgi:hypothetical protein